MAVFIFSLDVKNEATEVFNSFIPFYSYFSGELLIDIEFRDEKELDVSAELHLDFILLTWPELLFGFKKLISRFLAALYALFSVEKDFLWCIYFFSSDYFLFRSIQFFKDR